MNEKRSSRKTSIFLSSLCFVFACMFDSVGFQIKPWSLRLIDKTSATTLLISSALLNLYFHISFFFWEEYVDKKYISCLISLNFEH